MITIAEVLALPELRDCRVLAGAGGLGRVISSVTVMDTPDIARWLRGGELLLCNVFILRDDPQGQISLVADAEARGAAGLGVKTRRFVQGLPDTVRAEADRVQLPIIEIPEQFAWVDVMTPIHSHIINLQYSQLLQSSEVHRLFTELALQGKGLDDLAAALADLLQQPVLLVDRALTVTHRQGPGSGYEPGQRLEHLEPVLGVAAPVRGNAVVLEPSQTGLDVPLAAVAIARGEDHFGYILSPGAGANMPPQQLRALEHAATVATLEMLKRRAVAHARRGSRNDFLYDLLTGRLTSETAVRARAGGLGWELEGFYGVFTLELKPADTTPGGGDGADRSTRERLFRLAQRSVRSLEPRGLLMELGTTVTVLVPTAAPDRAEHVLEAANDLREQLQRVVGHGPVSGGVGRPYATTHVYRSYREAVRALQLGTMVWGEGSVTHYDNLGVFRIFSSANPHELSAFVAEFLGPIMDGETGGDSVLVETLERYFECDQSVPQTASQLYVHPNTIRYRLRRVERLTGMSLAQNRQRINLELALKIRQFLGAG